MPCHARKPPRGSGNRWKTPGPQPGRCGAASPLQGPSRVVPSDRAFALPMRDRVGPLRPGRRNVGEASRRPAAPGDETRVPDRSRRGFAREAALYGAGVVIARAVSFAMLPIYTRFLSPGDYGALQILQMVTDVTAILLSGGLASGVLRFTLKARTPEDRHAVVSTAFVLLTGLHAIGAVGLVLAAPILARSVLSQAGADGALWIRVVAGSFVLEAVLAVPMLWLQATRRAGLHTTASLGRLVLQLALNVTLVVFFGFGVLGVLIGTLVANGVVGGALTVLVWRETGLRPRRDAARDLRRYGLPYQVGMLGSFFLTFGDRFFLEHYRGLAAVGIYGLAYQFAFLLHGLGPLPYFRAWSPRRLALSTEPREIRDASYNQSLVELSLVLVSLAVAIALFVRPVLTILSAPEFRPAAELVPILLVATIFQVYTDTVALGIEVSEKTRYASLAIWISVGVILVLYALLIPPLGGLGAALATVASMAVRFACTLAFSQRLWPVAWNFRPSARLLGIATAAVALDAAIAAEGFAARVAVASVLLAAYLGAAWALVLDPALRTRLLALASSPGSVFGVPPRP